MCTRYFFDAKDLGDQGGGCQGIGHERNGGIAVRETLAHDARANDRHQQPARNSATRRRRKLELIVAQSWKFVV